MSVKRQILERIYELQEQIKGETHKYRLDLLNSLLKINLDCLDAYKRHQKDFRLNIH